MKITTQRVQTDAESFRFVSKTKKCYSSFYVKVLVERTCYLGMGMSIRMTMMCQ